MTISAYQGLGSIEQVMSRARMPRARGCSCSLRPRTPRRPRPSARCCSSRALGQHGRDAITQGVIGWNHGRADAATRALGSIGVVFGATTDLGSPASSIDVELPRPACRCWRPDSATRAPSPASFAPGSVRSPAVSSRATPDRSSRPVPMGWPTRSAAGSTSTERQLPEPISEPSTSSGGAATTRTASEVDRVAASRAAVAARRARAAVKAADRATARAAPSTCARGVRGSPRASRVALRVPEFLTSIPAIGATKPRASCTSSGSRRRSASAASGACSATGCASSSPTGSPAHGGTGDRLVVLAGPTAVGKGTVAGVHPASTTPTCGCRVSATTRAPAARRGRRRALLLRRRRASSTAWSSAASSSSTRPCTTPTATARRGRRSTRRSPPASSVLLEIDLQGARVGARGDARGDCWCSCCRRRWEELVRRLVGRGTERPGRTAAPARDREGRIARPQDEFE